MSGVVGHKSPGGRQRREPGVGVVAAAGKLGEFLELVVDKPVEGRLGAAILDALTPAHEIMLSPLHEEGSADEAIERLAGPFGVGRLRAVERGRAAVAVDGEDAAILLKEEGGFVAAALTKKRTLLPDEAVLALEHEGLDAAALALGAGVEVPLAAAAEVGPAVVDGRAPDVVAVGALQHEGRAPLRAIIGRDGVAEVLVHVPFLTRQYALATPPGAGVDKEAVLENKEMRIPRVPLRHGEAMHLIPRGSLILAAQDDCRGRGIHIVPLRAAAEGKIQLILEPDQIRERIVLPIVKDAAQVAHGDLRRISGRGREDCGKGERGNEQSRFHGSRSGFGRGDGQVAQYVRIHAILAWMRSEDSRQAQGSKPFINSSLHP